MCMYTGGICSHVACVYATAKSKRLSPEKDICSIQAFLNSSIQSAIISKIVTLFLLMNVKVRGSLAFILSLKFCLVSCRRSTEDELRP